MLFKKILVPLDGSALAEMALEPALALAQGMKGELVLLSVLPVQETVDVAHYSFEGAPPLPPDPGPMRERLVNYLDSIHASRAGCGVLMRTLVAEGNPAGCILETAVSEHIDLIVMGTHGRSGLSRWLLGSVTEKVLQQAECPVLAVRGQPSVRHILILADETMLAAQALDPGFALAGALHAQVHLLGLPAGTAGDPAEVFRQEESYLEDMCERYAVSEPLQTAVGHGKPEEAIAAYCQEQAIDLIVLAGRDRSGLRRWLAGNLFEKVLRKTNASLLAVRPEQMDA